MKDKLRLINSYKTPDDWKERAGKIAKGKGIYASVKTSSWLKRAIAAAVAVALGVEGYMLLGGSDGTFDEKLQPAPTGVVDDEATRQYVIKNRLKNYFPNATDHGIRLYAEKYESRGCGAFITQDNGIADSCSKRLETVGYSMGATFAPNVTCDGYIADGSRLIALVRFSFDESVQDLSDDLLAESLVPHVCVYDKGSQTVLKPESVRMLSFKGFMSYYARVEVELGEAFPASGFDDLEIDVHFYDKQLVGERDPLTLPDTNDEHIGIYHTDVKIRQTFSDVELTGADGYDTLIKRANIFGNDEAVYGLCELFGTGHITREPEAPDTLSDSVVLTSDGFVTDGVKLMLFYTAKAPGQPSTDKYFGAFERNTSAKLYLLPERIEIGSFDSLEYYSSYTDDPHQNARWIGLTLEPKYLLDGHQVEAVFSSTGEKGADVTFTYDLTSEITKGRRSFTLDTGYEPLEGADIAGSTLGVLIRGADRLINEKTAAAEKSEDTGSAKIGYLRGEFEPEQYLDKEGFAYLKQDAIDQGLGTTQWLPIISGGSNANIINILSSDGTSAGQYIDYNNYLGALKSIVFTDDIPEDQWE